MKIFLNTTPNVIIWDIMSRNAIGLGRKKTKTYYSKREDRKSKWEKDLWKLRIQD